MVTGTLGAYVPFGPQIGLGHIVRTSALARWMASLGWQTILLGDGSAPTPTICEDVFDVQLNALRDPLPHFDWLVVDHYRPDTTALTRLSEVCASKLMIVDLESQETQNAAIVLNQNLTANARASTSNQRVLLGPQFALLRPAFAMARPKVRQPDDRREIARVLLAIGATDPCNVLNRLVPALHEHGIAVDIVTSSLTSIDADLEALIAQGNPSVRLFRDAEEHTIANLLSHADLVIGGGGGGSWERCTVGAPSILLEIAENQAANITELVQAGAAISAGHAAADDMPQRVIEKIEDLRQDPMLLSRLSVAALGLCDGLGCYRVASELSPVTARDGLKVLLRPTTENDCDRLFRWQQLPETRKFARNQSIPTLDEHIDWFDRKRKSHQAIMNIIEVGDVPAGSLILDYAGEFLERPQYEVSIYLDPDFVGKGVAKSALFLASRLVPFAHLSAFVKQENVASLRLFRAAGYEQKTDGFHLAPII